MIGRLKWTSLALVLVGSATSEPLEAWRRLWRRSPAEFEGEVSRSLASRLERLGGSVHQGGRGWRLPLLRRSAASAAAAAERRREAALRLLLQIWRQRDDPATLLTTCDTLAALLDDGDSIDELEALLPQLAHLTTRLPADWLLTSVLERFVLRVCESNVHWALQLTWIAYSGLEENRPEAPAAASFPAAHLSPPQPHPSPPQVSTGDAEVHARCAALLHRIEQAVVYGAKVTSETLPRPFRDPSGTPRPPWASPRRDTAASVGRAGRGL